MENCWIASDTITFKPGMLMKINLITQHFSVLFLPFCFYFASPVTDKCQTLLLLHVLIVLSFSYGDLSSEGQGLTVAAILLIILFTPLMNI